MISEQDIHNLAELARIKISKEEEKKLGMDLEKILAHFEELKEVDTTTVEPMTGGTSNENIFRLDDGERIPSEKALKSFPETAGGLLKVPPVFE